jgi:hypothetical protein
MRPCSHAQVTGYDDSIDEGNDAATFGIHRRFSAKPSLKYSGVAPPDQYSEYSPMMDDGPWNDVKRPTGHHADKSGLVSQVGDLPPPPLSFTRALSPTPLSLRHTLPRSSPHSHARAHAHTRTFLPSSPPSPQAYWTSNAPPGHVF